MRQSHGTRALQGAGAIAGVAAALLVVLAARGAVPLFQPPTPDGYQVGRSDRYTLYAPSAEAVRHGEDEIRHARRMFRRHFGTEPLALVVFLADEPADFDDVDLSRLRRAGAGFLPFLTQRHLRSMDAAGPAALIAESRALSHEACHVFATALADDLAGGRSMPARAYGHAALPDWIDEMAATLCESPESKARRRAQLRAELDGRIPLAELARMEHPLTPERLGRIVRAAHAPAASPVQFHRGPEVERVLDGTKSSQFYAQSLSIGEFVFERGGSVALRALAGHLVAGRSLDEALREVSRVAPAIPPSGAELEKQWLAWVVSGN